MTLPLASPQTASLTPTEFAAAAAVDSRAALARSARSGHGQFFTPQPVALFMARLFAPNDSWTLLDAGAGVGILSAAAIEHGVLSGTTSASVVAYESDPNVLGALTQTL